MALHGEELHNVRAGRGGVPAAAAEARARAPQHAAQGRALRPRQEQGGHQCYREESGNVHVRCKWSLFSGSHI